MMKNLYKASEEPELEDIHLQNSLEVTKNTRAEESCKKYMKKVTGTQSSNQNWKGRKTTRGRVLEDFCEKYTCKKGQKGKS